MQGYVNVSKHVKANVVWTAQAMPYYFLCLGSPQQG